jgi:hypothetical protein
MPFTIDKEFEIPEYSPICSLCKHVDPKQKRKCKAFDEIPLEIWLGEVDHTEPYPGDNGIQFEPIEDKEP